MLPLYLRYRVEEYRSYGYDSHYYVTKFKWLALLVWYLAPKLELLPGGEYEIYADYRCRWDRNIILSKNLTPERKYK